MKLIKRVGLTCTIDNHNKQWVGELYDNDMVITRWGKIGTDLQFKEFPNAGEPFLEKKKNEKLKKGYEFQFEE